MNFNETVELEKNIEIKNKANVIYANFIKNVSLPLSEYEGEGKFVIWSDSNNKKSVVVHNHGLEYVCEFLHENYRIMVSPEDIFNAIKKKNRVIDHLKADSMGKR